VALLHVEPIAYPVCFFPGLPDSALRLSFLLSANRGLFYALEVFWVLGSGLWEVTQQEQDCCPRGGRFRGGRGKDKGSSESQGFCCPRPFASVVLLFSLYLACAVRLRCMQCKACFTGAYCCEVGREVAVGELRYMAFVFSVSPVYWVPTWISLRPVPFPWRWFFRPGLLLVPFPIVDFILPLCCKRERKRYP